MYTIIRKTPNSQLNMSETCIVWLRNDLRTLDNPALYHACKKFKKVIPLYIFNSKFGDEHSIGGASKWWLHHSLASLSKQIPLVIRQGDYAQELRKIIADSGASTIYFNKSYNPHYLESDNDLGFANIDIERFAPNLLIEPGSVLNNAGQPFKVFTPFWKSCNLKMPKFSIAPKAELSGKHLVSTLKIEDLNLLPTKPDWSRGFYDRWTCGEDAALDKFHKYVDERITRYKDGRNFPAKKLTSEMSPHLAHGEISVRYMYNYIQSKLTKDTSTSDKKNIEVYVSELGWREFSYNLLHHFPHITTKNFKENFNNFEWDKNHSHLEAWQKGQTGYPIVDAGMRELWKTGYMHNRVRMIVGSFLVKDLHIDWREGEKWFWDTLVDADIASNTASWQWVAGSGADASPYFRIFNPILQGEKFDPEGEYVKKWVPELKSVSVEYIHKPFLAPPLTLLEHGVELGKTYPHPIVNHKHERDVAMKKYEKIKV